MGADTLIFLIQLLHTAIFFVVAALILYMLVCGMSGRGSRRLLLAAFLVPTLIGVLWLVNGRECILSTAIYALAGGDRATPDILLPLWIAQWIMTGSTALMALSGVLVGWRSLTRRWQRRPAPGRNGRPASGS